MYLRVRVRLADRPGSLGSVARVLGAAGADVVQMVVLERSNGRALDDFTVLWPFGSDVDRLTAGLGALGGVATEGIWPTLEPQGAFPDAEVIGQVAAGRERGALTLVDAVPSLLSADWAALAEPGPGEPILIHTSSSAPPFGGVAGTVLPELAPLRPRRGTVADGTRFAMCPIGGRALVVARAPGGPVGAPPFHQTELFRLEQLVGAAEAVIGPGIAPADLVAPGSRAGLVE